MPGSSPNRLDPPRPRTLINAATPLHRTNGQLFGFVLLEADLHQLSVTQDDSAGRSSSLSQPAAATSCGPDSAHPEN
ncbi:MAG: hypothetical protein R3F27_12445 [Gammaproteobacteria bacterium]